MVKPVKYAPQIDVPDAIQWINTCISRVIGEDPGIDRFPVASDYGNPIVLVAENADGRRFLLSSVNPDALGRIRMPRRWPWPFTHLSRFRSNLHPLIPLSHHVRTFQLSTLNCGPTFLSEAPHVWKRLTGEDLMMKELWLYILPQPKL